MGFLFEKLSDLEIIQITVEGPLNLSQKKKFFLTLYANLIFMATTGYYLMVVMQLYLKTICLEICLIWLII